MASPKITKRSSTIIWGLQMESGTLRQLRESLTTLLWGLYDGPIKCSKMLVDSYTPMGPGQIAPCNPQSPSFKPWMGGSCSVSFVSLTSVGTIYSTVLEQILKFWQKAANFVLHLSPQCLLIVLEGLHVISFHRPASGSKKLPHR